MTYNRLKELRSAMRERSCDAFLVKYYPNVRYLSGYTGSNGLCYITMEKAVFFTDFRYKNQSRQQVQNMEIVVPDSGQLIEALKAEDIVEKGLTIAFEGNRVSHADYKSMATLFPDNKFEDTSMVIEEIASVKDDKELMLLQKAVDITDKGFSEILNDIKPGVTETYIGAKLSFLMKTFGSEEDSFAPIIASGVSGASPHHGVSDKLIEDGDLITMDFGAVYKGYHADMTRTVCVGAADEKQKEIYNIVLQAQLKGIAAAVPGVRGSDVDAVSRDYIKSKGYGEYFGHGLGHGIGLEVHTEPRLSQKYHGILKPGQVVTVEPGIYIPGWGGVRIEDDIILQENSPSVMNKSSKDLIEL